MFFSNKPSTIIFELTNRCNLKCRMCDIWKEQPKKDFSLELFESILKEKTLSKIKHISFTGGEPFMINNLKDYYLLTRKYAPKSYFNISTNGYFKDKIMGFLEIVNIKRTSVTVSYDGIRSHDLIRGKKGSARRLLQTAVEVKKRFPRVGLSLKFTITPENCCEILSTAEQAKYLEMPFHIKTLEKLNCAHTRLRSKDKPEFSRKVLDLINEQAKEILNLDIETNKKYIKDLIKKNSRKCMTCNWSTRTLFIGVDGKVWLCRKKKQIGNVVTNNIGEILASEKMRSVKRDMGNCTDTDCLSYDNR